MFPLLLFVYIQCFSDYSPLIIILPRQLPSYSFQNNWFADIFFKQCSTYKSRKKIYKDDGSIMITCKSDCFITFFIMIIIHEKFKTTGKHINNYKKKLWLISQFRTNSQFIFYLQITFRNEMVEQRLKFAFNKIFTSCSEYHSFKSFESSFCA